MDNKIEKMEKSSDKSGKKCKKYIDNAKQKKQWKKIELEIVKNNRLLK